MELIDPMKRGDHVLIYKNIGSSRHYSMHITPANSTRTGLFTSELDSFSRTRTGELEMKR